MKFLVTVAAFCCTVHLYADASPVAGHEPTEAHRGDILPGSCDLCLTKGCIISAQEVLSKMDLDIDPCDNFYKFTCGNFLKEANIPDDKTSISNYDVTRERVLLQLRSALEDPPIPDEARHLRLVKTLYRSCMNTTRIEEVGLSHIKSILKQAGGWPVLDGDEWDNTKYSWENTTYTLRNHGFKANYLFSIYVSSDYKNSSRRTIYLDEASLSISREFLAKGSDERLVDVLYNYMCDVAVLLGAERDRASRELKESLQFEIQLANASNTSLRPEERRDRNKLYNPMTVVELQERYPFVPWVEYFRRLLPESLAVNTDEVVIVKSPKYMKALEAVLGETPKRTQANYLLWRALASVSGSLTKAVRERGQKYRSEREGNSEPVPRWKVCLQHAQKSSLSLAFGSLYVRHFFKEIAKRGVVDMVGHIRNQMYKVLETADWMDEITRKNGLEKARSMTAHIAYPDEILDEKILDDYYSKLELSSGDYLEAVLNVTKFDLERKLSSLREAVKKNDWPTYGRAAVVNAFYDHSDNSIQFPAGILQYPFYSNEMPNYMNYGAIGKIIAHEITHGFDDKGRLHDKEGDLADWWGPNTKQAFLEKAACIIQQYGNYTVEQIGLKLNGVSTQGENIADNGGAKLAYHAYNAWALLHGAEQRLPGLERFTPRQMFWISAALKDCVKIKPEKLKLRVVTSSHSPGEFRVLGPFSNRAEFAEDFRCPLGSKMNPIDKCQVW